MLLSPDRLDALQSTGLLDSPCEEAFDRLTRLASSFLSAPICLISLVDRDRQFFKSAIGLPELARSTRATSLDYSFCRHVVETGQPLILADVRENPLTCANPLIGEAGVVAYAGVPLRTPAEQVLGTLCVLDVVPRHWTDREVQVLSDLAASTMTEIALRTELTQRERFERDVVERALLIERERLNAMFESAPAFIAWTRGSNHVIQGANRAFRQLVGFRDIVGKPVADALPEVGTSGLLAEVDRVVASGEPFIANGMPMRLQRDPDDEPEERFLNFVYQPLYEHGAAPTGLLCHGVDVTDQTRAAFAMERSERYHRHLLDTLPVIVYQAAPEPPYQAIYINKAIEVLGYSREEWLAEPEMWTRCLHPDDRARMRRQARDSYRSATPMDCQYRMVAKDGTVRWFHDRGEYLPDRSGERCVWQGIMLDITDRRAIEDALRQSEERHRLTFDEAGIGMAVCFVDGRIERANRALVSFLGYPQRELEGMSYLEVLHPDDAGFDAHESARLLAGEITCFSQERRYRRKDGSEVWALTTVTLLRDAAGVAVRRLAQLQDITNRRHAELALRASEAYNRKLVETAHEGIWVVDEVGVTTYANPRLCAMLGYEVRELEGRSLFEFMTSDSAFQARTLFARRQRGISEVHEFSLTRRDGTELFALLSTSPILSPEGRFTGALAMVTDITERRRAEEALRESEARYRHVVAHAPGMVYQWTYHPDGTGRYTFVSEGAEAILGVSPEDALRDPEALLSLIPDADRPRLREKALEAAAKSGSFHWEGRVILRSGVERYIEIAARDQRKADGTVGAVGGMSDLPHVVGARVCRIEVGQQEAGARLRAAASSIPEDGGGGPP
ncbi:MAG TPA: PAS domain S-box protein, partial [Gemmatimonadaceae bacterium]|nr:PAS domain S-box protein [Gemmatimonadaceae bacterium]